MRESEFDKYVRDLLRSAEEEVSPRVWEGVAAGLGNRRRIVPVFWGWVAAAAAVAAAFVVFYSHPLTVLSEETMPVQDAVAVVSAVPAPSAPVNIYVSGEEIPQPLPSKVKVAVKSAFLGDARVESATPQPVLRSLKAIEADASRLARVDANAYFNQLAFAQRKQDQEQGFSLIAAGHFQGNERGQVNGASAFPRSFSAPPAGAAEGIYNETPETSFRLPFSIGLGLRYNFTNRWAVGTGIRYTNLGRTFVGDFVSADGIVVPLTDIDNQQHWLGVPLNLYYDIVNRGRWRVHSFLGGAVEYLVVNDFLIHYSPRDLHYYQRGTTPQWSVAAGLGVEFRITPRVGIYMDPNVRYYFDAAQQPRSLRTIQPLRFDMEVGVRFSFGSR